MGLPGKGARRLAQRLHEENVKAEPSECLGHPVAGVVLTGSFSLALGLVLWASGLVSAGNEMLLGLYRQAGFALGEGGVAPWWEPLLLVVSVYLVAGLLFDIPGVARRVLTLLTLLVLVAAASPVLVLWGVFWSPLAVLAAGASSGALAIVWSRFHALPCEGAEAVGGGKVIPMNRGGSEGRTGNRTAPERKGRRRGEGAGGGAGS